MESEVHFGKTPRDHKQKYLNTAVNHKTLKLFLEKIWQRSWHLLAPTASNQSPSLKHTLCNDGFRRKSNQNLICSNDFRNSEIGKPAKCERPLQVWCQKRPNRDNKVCSDIYSHPCRTEMCCKYSCYHYFGSILVIFSPISIQDCSTLTFWDIVSVSCRGLEEIVTSFICYNYYPADDTLNWKVDKYFRHKDSSYKKTKNKNMFAECCMGRGSLGVRTEPLLRAVQLWRRESAQSQTFWRSKHPESQWSLLWSGAVY